MKTSQNGAIYKYLVGIKHQQTPFAFSENVVSGANEQIEVNTSKDIKGTVLAYCLFSIFYRNLILCKQLGYNNI